MTEKGTRLVFNEDTKTFEEGKAGPWMPPAQLRELPEDHYTKDDTDPDRAHELDPDHIVEALHAERTEAEVAAALPETLDSVQKELQDPFPITERIPLNERLVDVARFKAIRGRIKGYLSRIEHGDPVTDAEIRQVQHIWFPENDWNKQQLRPGCAPPVRERPYWLRRYPLEVDLFSWPRRIEAELSRRGVPIPDVGKMLDAAREVTGMLQ